MNESVRFGELAFDSMFASAIDATGKTIRFTRAERLLLTAFTRQTGRALSRDELMDATSAPGSDATDRSIDFLVNRLRRKLGEDARNPRYIGTRYGEGYVWMAQQEDAVRPSDSAFITVGPVRGLDAIPRVDKGELYAARLAHNLGSQYGGNNQVVVDKSCPRKQAGSVASPQFCLTLDFAATDGEGIDCSLTLRRRDSSAVLAVHRQAILSKSGREVRGGQIDRLCQSLINSIWTELSNRSDGTSSAEDATLDSSLIDASIRMNPKLYFTQSPEDGEKRLRGALRENPDDAVSKVMLATVLHSKYALTGTWVLAEGDPRKEDEAEIEQLVLEALADIEGNDIYMLAAAKLLNFVSPAHSQMALEMAEDAFEKSAAFSAAFATLGEFRLFEGRIQESLDLYSRGMEIAEPDTHFHRQMRAMSCYGLIAKGDRQKAGEQAAPLFKTAADRQFFALSLPPPDSVELGDDMETVLAAMTPNLARATILNAYYVIARMFRRTTHCRRVMERPVKILTERFGEDIIPNEAMACIPETFKRAVMA